MPYMTLAPILATDLDHTGFPVLRQLVLEVYEFELFFGVYLQSVLVS